MTEAAKMPDISPDMRDFFELLIKHGAQFALCGGFAVSYYGLIRTSRSALIDAAGGGVELFSRR
ncbi:MAG TPA: hypothetical protein DCS43_07650 [Verrucomicrobia bacterium]|nr:hypothetical protein [Verrucomicrobiota bacterium]